ncbi:MAG: hypothetical protein OEU92_20030 [Alphaproteobacteria bacterium]|nr:hypothetical protein [Alphaproteobacteria bacterium]
MRDSPVTALGVVIGLMLAGPLITYCIFWALLHYTNTALLVYKEEVAVSTRSSDTADRQVETMLHCSYFTGTRLLKRDVSPEPVAHAEDGPVRAARCPWRIDVS